MKWAVGPRPSKSQLARKEARYLVICGLALMLSGCAGTRQGSVTGSVVGFSPIAGRLLLPEPVKVSVKQHGRLVAESSFSGGMYRFKLPPGTYTVTLDKIEGYSGGILAYRNPRCTASRTVEVHPGEVSKGLYATSRG